MVEAQKFLIDIVDTRRFRVTIKAANADLARDIALAQFERDAPGFDLLWSQTEARAESAGDVQFHHAPPLASSWKTDEERT